MIWVVLALAVLQACVVVSVVKTRWLLEDYVAHHLAEHVGHDEKLAETLAHLAADVYGDD